MRPGDVEDEDALLVRSVDDVEPGRVEEARSTRRHAAHGWRIEIDPRRPVLLQCARPRLERHVARSRIATEARTHFPVPFGSLRGSKLDTSVRTAWSRRVRNRFLRSAAAAPSGTAASALRRRCTFLRKPW